MLQIVIPGTDLWDEVREEFVPTKPATLQLEHSLVSLSKWEQKHRKPFLARNEKTSEELIDYVRCMTITQNVEHDAYVRLSYNLDILLRIQEYIDDPMTATTFSDDPRVTGSNKPVTAEVIYYWMICYGIPFECRKWHLNSLLTLIKVCERKNRAPKKMSQRSIMSRNAALNAARRSRHNSKG